MAVTWRKLAYEDDVILKTVADANSLLYAVTDNTPAALALAANKFAARGSTGDIEAKSITDAALTILDDATVGDILATIGGAAATHATQHKNGGTDELLLSDLGEPTAAVKFDGQQATNFVLHTVADATARNALTAVVGKVVMQTDTLAAYLCTVAV